MHFPHGGLFHHMCHVDVICHACSKSQINVLYITLCCAHPYIHYYDSYDSYDTYDTYDMTSANDMTLSLSLCSSASSALPFASGGRAVRSSFKALTEASKERKREREMHITYTTYTVYIIYIIYTDACQQLPTHQDTQGFRDAKRIR